MGTRTHAMLRIPILHTNTSFTIIAPPLPPELSAHLTEASLKAALTECQILINRTVPRWKHALLPLMLLFFGGGLSALVLELSILFSRDEIHAWGTPLQWGCTMIAFFCCALFVLFVCQATKHKMLQAAHSLLSDMSTSLSSRFPGTTWQVHFAMSHNPSQKTLPEQLQGLHELHKQGGLTLDEFTVAKELLLRQGQLKVQGTAGSLQLTITCASSFAAIDEVLVKKEEAPSYMMMCGAEHVCSATASGTALRGMAAMQKPHCAPHVVMENAYLLSSAQDQV